MQTLASPAAQARPATVTARHRRVKQQPLSEEASIRVTPAEAAAGGRSNEDASQPADNTAALKGKKKSKKSAKKAKG